MTGLVLRRARPEDADFLAELAGEAFATYGDYRPLIAAWADDPSVEVTLAESDGARAGFAILSFLRPGEAPHTKVGDLLALAVAEGNTAARSLFEAAGFAYRDAEGSYPRGQKALHMSLDLPARARWRRLI